MAAIGGGVSKGQALLDAVCYHKVGRVRELLGEGVDPNHAVIINGGADCVQPTTPLCMVVFCISDCLLTDKDQMEFKDIAKLLVQAGAETGDALKMAEERYRYDGKITDDTELDLLHQVLQVVAVGKLQNFNEVHIRPGSSEDLDSIVKLTFALANETEQGLVLDEARTRVGVGAGLIDRAETEPRSGRLRPRYWVASIPSGDNGCGRVDVGFVASSPEWSDWWGCEYWWITSVYVAPQCRRLGVGKRLFKAVFASADDANVQTVNLRVEKDNESAKRFYEAVGFKIDDSHHVLSKGKRPDGSSI